MIFNYNFGLAYKLAAKVKLQRCHRQKSDETNYLNFCYLYAYSIFHSNSIHIRIDLMQHFTHQHLIHIRNNSLMEMKLEKIAFSINVVQLNFELDSEKAH